jgi:DNA-binding Lrp family transcriptional regulator
MKSKIKKLLFEYTRNARITTKELGKNIGASQQSASYLLNILKKKKAIEASVTIVDAVKFGYINVLTGINLVKTDIATKKEILDELKKIPSITSIEECKEGVDFLVEHITPNLSAFNKTNLDLIQQFSKKMKIVFIYPVIVIHEYYKNYLARSIDPTDKVLFGDRVLKDLSREETIILQELVKDPEKKLIDISETTKIPIKSVINVKRELEKKNIIKGYTAVLNNEKLGIQRQILFLKFPGEGLQEIDKFADYAKNNRNIVKFWKMIGEYQIGIIVEDCDEIEVIKEIRENFPIDNYRIMKSEKIHKKMYLPLQEPEE